MTMQGKGLGFEAWMSVLSYLKKDPQIKRFLRGRWPVIRKW